MFNCLIGREFIAIPTNPEIEPYPVKVVSIKHYRGFDFLYCLMLDGPNAGYHSYFSNDQLMIW